MDQSHCKQESLFIRQNAWCKCERSCNVSTGELEIGVSVYSARRVDAHWEAYGLAFQKRERTFDSQRELLGGIDREGNPIPWYLVSGEMVGTGSDGEPLLKNVRAIARLQWDGARFFDVVEDGIRDFQHLCHEEFPDCVCDSVETMLEAETQELEDDDDIEMGDAYERLDDLRQQGHDG